MLFTFALVVAISGLLGEARLIDKLEQSVVLVGRPSVVEIELEVDEKVLVLHLAKLKQADVLLLLLIDLHVTIMPHDPLVQFRCRQSILSYEVEHVFILEFAYGRLLIA